MDQGAIPSRARPVTAGMERGPWEGYIEGKAGEPGKSPSTEARQLAVRFLVDWRRTGVALLLASAAACDDIPIFARPEPPTAYERYAVALQNAGLDSSALGTEWLAASDSAMQQPVPVTLPYQELVHFERSEARSVAYRLALQEGLRVSMSVSIDGAPARLFVDLFQLSGNAEEPFRHVATAEPDSLRSSYQIAHEVRDSGTYVVRIQPELLRSGRYLVRLVVGPTLAFPVNGKDNRAVMSVFGVDRDGGRRRHHGIDIFAARGTPVLAVTPGFVRSTEPNNLGGNVVWLSDQVRQQSLYYAHLDTVIVSRGQEVRVGDTLGFVGNTGNARTTKPHLHFGIYRRGRGPVDPYPYVRLVTLKPEAVRADTARLGRPGAIRGPRIALREAPRERSDTVASFASGSVVRVIAAAGSWYRVLREDGVAGYLPARQVGAAARTAADGGGQ
jgi:peptidoglycan LD-endopeptidase LytH